MRHLTTSIALLLTLLFQGCGEQTSVTPRSPGIDLDLEIQIGWGLFRAGDFEEAAVHFSRIVNSRPTAASGHVGVGWCQLKLGSSSDAFSSLTTATDLGNDPDGFAGLTVAATALGRDSIAVAAAYEVSDPSYVFLGDPDFDFSDLVYLRALGEFHLERYRACYESLRVLDPGLEINLNEADAPERLLAVLEALSEQV